MLFCTASDKTYEGVSLYISITNVMCLIYYRMVCCRRCHTWASTCARWHRLCWPTLCAAPADCPPRPRGNYSLASRSASPVTIAYTSSYSPEKNLLDLSRIFRSSSVYVTFIIQSVRCPGVMMIVQAFLGHDRVWSIAIFTLALTINGAVTAGYLGNGLDIAPNFSGK